MVLALPEDGVEGEAASAKLGDQLIDVFASVIDSAAGGLSEELPVARVVRRVEDAPAPVTVDAAVSLREQGLVGNGGKKRKEGAAAATPAVEAVPEPATDGGKKKKKKSAQSQ